MSAYFLLFLRVVAQQPDTLAPGCLTPFTQGLIPSARDHDSARWGGRMSGYRSMATNRRWHRAETKALRFVRLGSHTLHGEGRANHFSEACPASGLLLGH